DRSLPLLEPVHGVLQEIRGQRASAAAVPLEYRCWRRQLAGRCVMDGAAPDVFAAPGYSVPSDPALYGAVRLGAGLHLLVAGRADLRAGAGRPVLQSGPGVHTAGGN